MDTTIRSLLKALSWRIVGTLSVFIISWIVTRSITIATTITIAEIITKMVLYWLHAWAWNRTSWGKDKVRLPSPQSFQAPPPVERKPVRNQTRRVYT